MVHFGIHVKFSTALGYAHYLRHNAESQRNVWDQNRVARLVAMIYLMNTTMVEGTLVRDHVLKMISLLNELEILGSDIDGETQVDIILQSLPDSFK